MDHAVTTTHPDSDALACDVLVVTDAPTGRLAAQAAEAAGASVAGGSMCGRGG